MESKTFLELKYIVLNKALFTELVELSETSQMNCYQSQVQVALCTRKDRKILLSKLLKTYLH